MKKSFLLVFLRLLQLLLGSPSQGPAVDVPPPTTVAAILGFIAGSAGKVCLLFSHVEGNRSGRPHWNKWKSFQYGGHCNDIQDLCLLTALVDYGRLTLIHPG